MSLTYSGRFVIVNYKAARHHKWAREQLGKEVG